MADDRQVLTDNLDSFVPEPDERSRLSDRIGVHATVAGSLMALAGAYLPWWSVAGVEVRTTVPVALLALLVLALAAGRYLVARASGTLAWGQLAAASVGLLVSIGPLFQALRLSQIPLVGLFVGVGLGGLVSLAGFAIVAAAACLDQD